MALIIIPKGEHKSQPRNNRLFWKPTEITATVTFTESCRYDLKNEDQADINKLFGVGYVGLNGLHQADSARFGWAYDPVQENIGLYVYCYRNKERTFYLLDSVAINVPVKLSIQIQEKWYTFRINDGASTAIYKTHSKPLAYWLSPYFGGNQPAPHTIYLDLVIGS